MIVTNDEFTTLFLFFSFLFFSTINQKSVSKWNIKTLYVFSFKRLSTQWGRLEDEVNRRGIQFEEGIWCVCNDGQFIFECYWLIDHQLCLLLLILGDNGNNVRLVKWIISNVFLGKKKENGILVFFFSVIMTWGFSLWGLQVMTNVAGVELYAFKALQLWYLMPDFFGKNPWNVGF